METTVPMQAVKVNRVCSHCQQGLMQGVEKNGDQFLNVCGMCKFTELHPYSYPYMRFEEIKQ